MTITPPASLCYGLAVLAVAIALLVKLLLTPLIAGESPFLLFFGAVMVSAWYGGMGPGLLATILAALMSNYFFLVPLYSFVGQSSGQNLRLCLFVIEEILISLLNAALPNVEASDKVENSGIGLALVKKIVESKGGTIWLESLLGQGTTLHFT